jgi:hypothetical protein
MRLLQFIVRNDLIARAMEQVYEPPSHDYALNNLVVQLLSSDPSKRLGNSYEELK